MHSKTYLSLLIKSLQHIFPSKQCCYIMVDFLSLTCMLVYHYVIKILYLKVKRIQKLKLKLKFFPGKVMWKSLTLKDFELNYQRTTLSCVCSEICTMWYTIFIRSPLVGPAWRSILTAPLEDCQYQIWHITLLTTRKS